MFKTLLRTLSALSIVTITASAGFADQHDAQPRSVNCADLADKYHPTCRAKIPPVTTGVWAGSFVDPKLSDSPDTVDRKDQFLAPSFAMEVYEDYERVNLKLDTDGNGRGDTIIGTSIFYITKNVDTNRFNYYAGILSGVDLGAPITEAFPDVVWKARFKAILVSNTGKDLYVSRPFDLRVSFTGTSDEGTETTAGEISARIPHVGRYSFQVDGQFNAKGVITGTGGTNGITYGYFANAQAKPTDTIVGTLTGIIGEKGALGAFHSDGAASSDRIRGFTGGFRANGFSEEDLEVLRACSLDPFDSLCNEDRFNDLKDARVVLCTQGDKAGAASLRDNPIECDNAVGVHDCLVNPFKASCTAEDSDFKKYLDIAQANRAVFCGKRGNVAKSLCKGDSIVADVCGVNPFGEVCGSDYDEDVNEWLISCEAGTVAADDLRCVQAKPINKVCAENPFGANCGFDAFDEARKTFTGYCLRDNILCTDDIRNKVLKRPNAVTWANSFGDTPLPLTPDTVNPKSQFLQGTAGGLDNGDVEIATNSRGELRSYSWNLNTATFDGLELGGDAADGVAYFHGTNGKRYAGIFSGTDLGAPLVRPTEEADMMMTWYGQFQWTSLFSGEFTLDIKFNTESTGTVKAFVHRGFSIHYYLLDGTFDANGVISGTVGYGGFPNHDRIASRIYSTSVLTGLIGAEGAVGVFGKGRFVASSKSAADAFDPNVKASDWVRSFGNAPRLPTYVPYMDTRQTRFLQGEGIGLSTFLLGNVVRPANPLTLANVRTDGEVADGVAYMSGTQIGDYNRETGSYDITTHHVAGILSGTDLGAVLDTSVAADWSGKLGMIVDGSVVAPRDITLTVDFTNKKLKIADSNINNTHFASFVNDDDHIGWDKHGVLRGIINYRAASDGEDSKGTVRGLIGKDGAVAAFRSDEGSVTPYAGGFVAVPSAVYVETVSFSDWVSSFGNSSSLPVQVPSYDSQQTRFLRGTGTGLSTRRLRDLVQPVNPLTLADGDLGGEAADGVTYVSGIYDFGSTRNPRHYAGLLSGTNLGAVLKVRPAVNGRDATANWAGKLGMIVNGAIPVESSITLNVNQTNKTIYLNRTAIGQGAVYFSGVRWNEHGVLSGGVMTYDPNDSTTNITGTVTGLIGQQGAVGAFRSTGTVDTPYVGGFVAVPPSE